MEKSVSSGRPGSHSSPQTLLAVRDLRVAFGGLVALDGVSFDVHEGAICGLIGPNGAGKTTLFNCLSRLYTWDAGNISLRGQEIGDFRREEMVSAGVGRTFQNIALFPSLSVRENILMGFHAQLKPNIFREALRLPGSIRNSKHASKRADELIEYFELDDCQSLSTDSLPFGTKKRVELARALASQPTLLLLDEPACGLNHQEVLELAEIVLKVRKEYNLSVLLVEHNMSMVMSLCDEIVVLNFGKVIAAGTPSEIREHPAVISAYLG